VPAALYGLAINEIGVDVCVFLPDRARSSNRVSIRLRVRKLPLAVRVARKTDLAPYRLVLDEVVYK